MDIVANSKIVVLYASEYKVEREASEGGGYVEGVTVSYLYGDDIMPTLNGNGSMGQRPAKASVHISKWNQFESVPGLYDGSFGMSVDSKGKPTLVLQEVSFLGLVQIKPVKSGEAHAKPAADAKSGVPF